jgi:L-fucose isomerase-like protein
MKKTTLAMIVGTRDFFPAEPVLAARREVIALLEQRAVDVVIPAEDATHMGALETWEDAKKWAAYFRQHRDDIDGILVCLPVFAPERGIADAIKLSELQVPILVQAYPDPLDELGVATRGDAYCGKISLTNNLYQYGYPFTLTDEHTVHPLSASFDEDLRKFVGVCRVVRGLRRARIGAVGARPAIFNTVRYSEKLLQDAGITVTTADLSEMFGPAEKLADGDGRVQRRLAGIREYIDTGNIPPEPLLRMAKYGVVLDDWVAANELDATALQCWTSVQQNYGINVCTLMSMMSDMLMPSGCEVDVTGVVSMYALQLASGRPSALVDWNNNYGDDPDKCVLFHCGNWAKTFFGQCDVKMSYGEILATVLGKDRTYGSVSGRAVAAPITFARLTTDDRMGQIHTYVGEGRITDDPLDTFGSRAVVEIPGLKWLMQYVCKNGFEHHTAMNASLSADILHEAFETYMGWEVYHHGGGDGCTCG